MFTAVMRLDPVSQGACRAPEAHDEPQRRRALPRAGRTRSKPWCAGDPSTTAYVSDRLRGDVWIAIFECDAL
jgi:hypothetical protein